MNRIVTWTERGIEYEGDQRHVEIAMKQLGLNEESREVGVPIVKEDNDKGKEKDLDRSGARQFRGIIARMNYLGQDRSHIQFAIKELSRGMAEPTEDDKGRIKKLINQKNKSLLLPGSSR